MKSIIIIDTWDRYVDGFTYLQKYIESSICKIAQFLNKVDIPVVCAAYNTVTVDDNITSDEHFTRVYKHNLYWKKPHLLIKTQIDSKPHNRICSYDMHEVTEFLNKHKVTELYYCGMSLPGCIEDRELGLKNMIKLGYDCSIIIDCCLNLSTPSTNSSDRIHAMYSHIIKNNTKMVFSHDPCFN